MSDTKAKFTGTYKKFARGVFLFAYNRLGNRQDSEDVLADTFTAIWANIENFPHLEEDEIGCRKLCFTIARNKLNDIFRERYRLQPWITAVDVDNIPELPQQRNPGANNIIKQRLEKLISKLNERDKVFYQLRFQQDYKLSEISQELGISLNNTKVIQNRLIKKLKNLWMKE